MENVNLVKNFWQNISDQKWDNAKSLLSNDAVVNWPQSRERICGSENFISINKHYPGNHTVEVLHLNEIGNKVITTVWITADTGQKTFATSYFKIKSNKISEIEEYWAEPYPAPDWRKQWVQPF